MSSGLLNSVLIKGTRQSSGLLGGINDVNMPGGKNLLHTLLYPETFVPMYDEDGFTRIALTTN